MLTTLRGDRDGGVGGATPKGVGAIWSSSEDGGITIHPNFNSPLEIMMAADAGQVLLQLIEIRVRTESRPRRRVKCLKEPIPNAHPRLVMVACWLRRCGADKY